MSENGEFRQDTGSFAAEEGDAYAADLHAEALSGEPQTEEVHPVTPAESQYRSLEAGMSLAIRATAEDVWGHDFTRD